MKITHLLQHAYVFVSLVMCLHVFLLVLHVVWLQSCVQCGCCSVLSARRQGAICALRNNGHALVESFSVMDVSFSVRLGHEKDQSTQSTTLFMSNTCRTHVIHMSYTCHTHDTCHTHVLHVYTHVIHVSYTFHTHVLHMPHTCHTPVIHMSYTCRPHVIHMSYTRHTRVIHMSYTCHIRVIHISYICHTCHTHVIHMSYGRFPV